jgi:hypothetical protein
MVGSGSWGDSLKGGGGGLRLALTVVVVACLILPLWVVCCSSRQHFFDVTGELYVSSAAEHYEEALRRATEWKRDAYLFSVTADVASSSGAPPTGGDLAYYFQSITTRRSFLTLRLIDGAWTSEVNSKTSAETYPAIARENWVLDSVDAWSIALANGGEEFLIEHQEPLTSMQATLMYRAVGDEDLLVWSVDFLILFGPRLLLEIDPATGEILEVTSR